MKQVTSRMWVVCVTGWISLFIRSLMTLQLIKKLITFLIQSCLVCTRFSIVDTRECHWAYNKRDANRWILNQIRYHYMLTRSNSTWNHTKPLLQHRHHCIHNMVNIIYNVCTCKCPATWVGQQHWEKHLPFCRVEAKLRHVEEQQECVCNFNGAIH